MSVIDVLKERGFIDMTTHDIELQNLFENEKVTCYIGFDPTASSLHIGSLVPIMSLAHMQRHGHRPIALVGGGTGLVGDPSGKTEMRKMLTEQEVELNASGLKSQLSRFINFENEKALMVNNAQWLCRLEYIPFLRDYGRHFSVNRMIKAESYKNRLDSEDGLSFIEFNYMVLQAYDFLELLRNYGCKLQMGGSDQWGNIVAGIDLIRRVEQKPAFGITFPLMTTSSGTKMGKTERGTIWLDGERTPPYQYFQYWVNTDDRDVCRFLALFTFLPMDEIRDVEKHEGAKLNHAKKVLAYETTRLAHGKQEAENAFFAASSMFGASRLPDEILPSSSAPRCDAHTEKDAVPTSYIPENVLANGIPAFKIFNQVGLTKSGSASRRLIEQGGAYVNGQRVADSNDLISINEMMDGEIILRAGKKKYHRVLLEIKNSNL